MKKNTYLLSLLLILLLMAGCRSFDTKNNPTYYTRKKLAQYPNILGYEKKAILLPTLSNKAADDRQMIEVFATKTLLLDCNYYGLQGEFVKKTFRPKGLDYYLFDHNGDMYSTRMACPDTTLVEKTVTSQPLLLPYKNEALFVFYATPSIDIKYNLWQSGTLTDIAKEENQPNHTAQKYLTYYPIEIDGMSRKIIYLPVLDEKDELNRKVEIVMGKNTTIDNCNHHKLLGEIEEKNIVGMGFSYYIVHTDGEVASTRKGCPDDTKSIAFVSGATQLIEYNSNLPIVVFAPKGIDVKYNIWKTDGKMR